MKKNQLFISMVAVCFFTLANCGVKDVVDEFDDAAASLECIRLVKEFEEANDANPDRSCTDIVADIDQIERTCNEFLSASVKAQFALLRDACGTGG